MAMQYQLSSEIQAEGLRTLYLMNPNFLGYPDSNPQPQSNFLNPSATGHALSSFLTPHAPLALPHDPGRPLEEIPSWFLHSSSNELPNTPLLPQGLSLSLPRDQRHPQFFPAQSTAGIMATSRNPTADHSMKNAIMGSKYVKAAQELLEEMVSVLQRGAKNNRSEGVREKAKMVFAKTEYVPTGGDVRGCNKGGGGELTMAQRQEVLMKKAKLSSMLEEVNERCKQYDHRMQLIVSSFEHVAGVGSARSYTEVALRMILRQFGRLRVAILGQIKDLNKSLWKEEEEGFKMGSRQRMADEQLRRQSAVEQAGMMTMTNTMGRPGRGLPERAIAILRTWLFDHFVHPYPKYSDKQMLAKKTGLTRSQVSNWFINARVRLWKPMVETMYLEETNNPIVPTSKTMTILEHTNPTDPTITTPKPDQSPIKTNNPGAVVFHTVYGPGSISQFNPDPDHQASGFQGNGFSLSLALPSLETSAGAPQHNNFMAARTFPGINNNLQGNSQNINNYEILDFQNRRKTTTFQPRLLPHFCGHTG